MSMEENTIIGLFNEEFRKAQFPAGLHVLAVDDDDICLRVVEALLRKCQYQVTTCTDAFTALHLLRTNRNKYDLIISDVEMPGMNGFDLLERVVHETDIPVIMLSVHSGTPFVMRGIKRGAVDYLVKPPRLEEIKNIWQHIIRKKISDSKKDKLAWGQPGENGQTSQSSTSTCEQEAIRKRKAHSEDDQEEEEEEEEKEGEPETDGRNENNKNNSNNNNNNEEFSSQKKPRVVWSVELHRKFVIAVNHIGLDQAVPKKILESMGVEGLTRENVASHLQKYRLYLKRVSMALANQENVVVAIGGQDPSFFRMGLLDGFADVRALNGPSVSLSSYQPNGMIGRLNNAIDLSGVRGITSNVIQQGLNNSINILALSANQNQNGTSYQGIPNSVELRQLPPNRFGESNQHVFGSSSNSLSTASLDHLLLQQIRKQVPQRGAFGNHSSLGMTSANQESLAMVVRGSSNFLDRGRSSENWHGAVKMSNFPLPSLSTTEALGRKLLLTNNLQGNASWTGSHLSNSPINLSTSMANSACLEDPKGKMPVQFDMNNSFTWNTYYPAKQHWGDCCDNPIDLTTPMVSSGCWDDPKGKMPVQVDLTDGVTQDTCYTEKQQWGDHGQDHIGNLNHSSFSQVDSLVSASGSVTDQSSAVSAETTDVSFFNQLSGEASYISHQLEGETSALGTILSFNEDNLFEQTRPQNDFGENNFDFFDLEDMVLISMMKPMQEETNEDKDGELIFDLFPLGPCM